MSDFLEMPAALVERILANCRIASARLSLVTELGQGRPAAVQVDIGPGRFSFGTASETLLGAEDVMYRDDTVVQFPPQQTVVRFEARPDSVPFGQHPVTVTWDPARLALSRELQELLADYQRRLADVDRAFAAYRAAHDTEDAVGGPPSVLTLAGEWEALASDLLKPVPDDDDPLGRPRHPSFAEGATAGTLRECARELRERLREKPERNATPERGMPDDEQDGPSA